MILYGMGLPQASCNSAAPRPLFLNSRWRPHHEKQISDCAGHCGCIPLPLTDEQRKQIYDAVIADKSQPVAGADALKPASELSPNQALKGMHPLPESVRGIDGLTRLYFVKAKGRVLLIEPATRTVVGQITG